MEPDSQGQSGHENYLKNMLINRLAKKFPQNNAQLVRTVEVEVSNFS